MKMLARMFVLTCAVFMFIFPCGETAWAQENPSHSHDDTILELSHPLIAESPLPETKVRLDYFFSNDPGKADEAGTGRHTLRFEAEYAFTPWLSLDVAAPYTFLKPDEGKNTDRLDNVKVGLKYANYAFAQRGLLLGGGIDLGLPTGNEEAGIGSDHVVKIEPFVDFGYKRERLEIVGFTFFGLPINEEDAADLKLGWNLSVLYHMAPRIQTLLEFNGEHVFGGEEAGVDVVNATPGIKIEPFADPRIQVGVGVSLPMTSDKQFHARSVFSVFYFF